MKIAQVTATFPPYWGGTGNVAYFQSKALVRRGHAVTVFTARGAGSRSEAVHPNFPVAYFPPWIRLGNAPLTPKLFTALNGFDIVHLHYPYIFGAELTVAACRFYKIPLVVTYHNHLSEKSIVKSWLFSGYNTIVEPWVWRGAQRMVGVSRDHIMRYTHDRRKVAIIPNGVDLEVFKPRRRSLSRARLDLAADRQIVLFVAALDSAHRSKNLGGLLESFAGAKLAKGLLVVVGDGDLKRSYQLLARQLGIGRQVVFLGAMPPSELPDVYSAADVTVVPSIDQESFGLTVVESWACGTPVIASSLPGMGSLVSEGVDGCLVQPGDVDALSAALKQALVDPTTLERWGESGLEKVHKRFNWDGIAQTLEDLYQDAVLKPDAAARRRAN